MKCCGHGKTHPDVCKVLYSICSGEKTKLVVFGTEANRRRNMEQQNKSIVLTVCDKHIGESTSDKLLGMVINNTGTWKHFLYGNKEEKGLISQLAKRVGILKRIRRYMTAHKFKMVANCLFYSKLIYCMSLWGSVWDIPGILDETERTSPTISKEDVRKLQTLQNTVLRLSLIHI